MSGSVCNFSKDLGNERSPLILHLYEEETSLASVREEEDSHGDKVKGGVAMLLGRWPGYVASACIAASAIAVLTIIMIATQIVTETMLDYSMRSELEAAGEPEILGIGTHCRYQKEEDEIRNNDIQASDYNIFNIIGLQNISPFEVVNKNISATDVPVPAQRKLFFVTTNEALSKRHLCAVESAAKFAADYNVYIIMLSINNTKDIMKSYKHFEKLSKFYPNIKLFSFKGDTYFRDSPMRDILLESNVSLSFVEFAARILTLWRYGGITYHLDLITLGNHSRGTYPVPRGDNVIISTDGGNFMSVRSRCHALLYDMMMSVNSAYARRHETRDLSSNDVTQLTLRNVCYNAREGMKPGTSFHEEPYKTCKGISAVPRDMICRRTEGKTTGNGNCVWTWFNGKNVNVIKNLCPLSYRQYTLKEATELKRTGTHKFRHERLF